MSTHTPRLECPHCDGWVYLPPPYGTAPELLEALEALFNAWDGVDWETIKANRNRARAAIAKAKPELTSEAKSAKAKGK
jgi:hypothetical protein